MLRLGLIDFDSSHCLEYTRRINHCVVPPDQFVDGARIVLGYPGGSEQARSRIDEFTPQVRECGVDLVDNPEQMLGQVDGVLVLSLQGDRHLEAARPFVEAGVPTYIDKPIACRAADLQTLMELAASRNTPVWSSSAARFADDVVRMRDELPGFGAMTGLQVFGPAHQSPLNLGLFHYGIHITEIMFTLMGRGCERLTALTSDDCDLVGARWQDGRVASIRGHRSGDTGYGFTCFTERGILHHNISLRTAYRNLCQAIIDAFAAGKPPVPLSETLEIVRFLEAVEESRHSDGRPVSLN